MSTNKKRESIDNKKGGGMLVVERGGVTLSKVTLSKESAKHLEGKEPTTSGIRGRVESN